MDLLVTGCAGFIGSHVAGLALDEGHQVVGLDSLNDAYDPVLKEWRLARLAGREGFTFHRADITDRDAVDALMEGAGFDAVVNLAARAGVRQSIDDPWTYLDTNGQGTVTLLDACRRHDVPRLLLASTSSLYGNHNETPFAEDADTDRPLSPYAASKKAAEAMAASYHHLYGIHTAVPRYFTVYGPAGRPDMSVFRFIKWISEGEPLVLYGDGSQERDFTYVQDIARGTLSCLGIDGHEVVNLGSDRPAPLSAVIAQIEERVGRKAQVVRRPMPRADVRATWADITKARRLLGWEPRTSLADGLEVAVAWYQENRTWAKDIDTGML